MLSRTCSHSSRTSIMARNFKKLKLILPAQLPGATKQKSNVLAALDALKDELDPSGSSDSESEDDSESSSGKEHEEGEEEDEEDGEHKIAEIPTPPATVTKKRRRISKKGVSIDKATCHNFALHSLTFYF